MNPQNFHSLESTLQKYFIYDTHMRNSPRKSIPFTNRDHGGEYCTVEEFSRRLTRSLALREGITGGEVRVRCRITRVIFVGGGPICI